MGDDFSLLDNKIYGSRRVGGESEVVGELLNRNMRSAPESSSEVEELMSFECSGVIDLKLLCDELAECEVEDVVHSGVAQKRFSAKEINVGSECVGT